MNQTELEAQLILWRDKKKELNELEQIITAAVMEGEKTVNFENVRASYSGGRKTYKYRDAAIDENAPYPIIEVNTTTTVRTDWKTVCEQANVVLIPFTQSKPSVTLKFKFM